MLRIYACIYNKDANFRLNYVKHSIEIYKTVIQLSVIFSTIAFYYAVSQGGKRREGMEWEATLNQGDSPSFPDTCHV